MPFSCLYSSVPNGQSASWQETFFAVDSDYIHFAIYCILRMNNGNNARYKANSHVLSISLGYYISTNNRTGFDNSENPCSILGIENVVNQTGYIYKGIVPPEPTPTKKTNKFKWVLYAKKLRERRIL